MLSDTEIEIAKSKVKYSFSDGVRHDNNDCIRMAYEWLDAQRKIKNLTTKSYPLKHIIEKWAGRYISTSDVDVAAFLHPDICGEYPHFNISARLIEPPSSKLKCT